MSGTTVSLASRSLGTPEEACYALRHISKNGAGVSITDLDDLDPSTALRLLELFLHDPGMKGPIEPFAAILSAAVEKRSVALWDLLSINQDADAGWRPDSQEFLRALPRECPDCLSCGCFPVCVGYGAWAHSCATWKAVIARIGAAARELRALRHQRRDV